MPSNVYWIEQSCILSVDYTNQVTVDDVKSAAFQAVIALRAQPVYFLVDWSQAQAMPPAALQLPSFSAWIDHPNARWFAYIGASGLAKSLLQSRQRGSAKFFSERESALAFLQSTINYSTQT